MLSFALLGGLFDGDTASFGKHHTKSERHILLYLKTMAAHFPENTEPKANVRRKFYS